MSSNRHPAEPLGIILFGLDISPTRDYLGYVAYSQETDYFLASPAKYINGVCAHINNALVFKTREAAEDAISKGALLGFEIYRVYMRMAKVPTTAPTRVEEKTDGENDGQ